MTKKMTVAVRFVHTQTKNGNIHGLHVTSIVFCMSIAQAFYAGGSDSSGQQVLGPSRNKNSKDFVSNIFKSAKESGAEVVENPHESRPSGSRKWVFGNTKHR